MRYVTRLLKTSCKSHLLLFEYAAPFEREGNPLYNDTNYPCMSILTEIINKELPAR